MIIENLSIPKVVQENLTDIIKLYVRYGPDYNLISKEFQLIVEQKISTKFISQFCFNLNKKTYQIIVDYLKEHKEQKGEKQFNYDNLWPHNIEEPEIITQIQNLPTEIMRLLNKDLSQAYNLLMESLSDPTLKKLIKYDRIRDLYQFVTQRILQKKGKSKKDRKQKKQISKQVIHKKISAKTSKEVSKTQEQNVLPSTEWNQNQERYLCAFYLERSLIKCCEKMKEKFGQSEKWNTSKKVYKKAEQIFQKSLKKVFRSNQLKSLKLLLEELQTNKENLIFQLVSKKSNLIEKLTLKLYKTSDSNKKSKIIEEINNQMLIILQKPQILRKKQFLIKKIQKQQQKVKQEEIDSKYIEYLNSDKKQAVEVSEAKQDDIKIETFLDEKNLVKDKNMK